MDASQLQHAGIKVQEKTWYDTSLLARLCANELIGDEEDGKRFYFSLSNLASHFLKNSFKDDLIEKLMNKYHVKTLTQLYSLPSLVHKPIFQEYALHDVKLVQKLHSYFQDHPNYSTWLRLSPLHFSQWWNGFQGVSISIKDVNERILEMRGLQDQILTKLPDITTPKARAGLKGWSSPQLISQYLKVNFSFKQLEVIPKTGKSFIYSFTKKVRLRFLQKIPWYSLSLSP